MVKFNRSNDSNSSKKSRNNRRKLNVSFCAELELDKRNTIKLNSNDESLKRIDPSVLYVHSTNILTRYEANELLALKDSRQSQAPPACMYSPHIIKLNILKFSSDHSKSYEKECESFREKLHNLSLSSFDPKFLELLSNFNNGLLYNVAANPMPANVPIPNLGNFVQQLPNFINNRRMYFQQQAPPQQNQQQNRRHVSWNNHIDEKIIETRQDNYQNMNNRSNFFDNMSSSASENQSRQYMGRNTFSGHGKFRGPITQNPYNNNRNYNNNNYNPRFFYQPKRCQLNPITVSQNSSGTSVDDHKETSISTDSSKRTDDSMKKDDNDNHGLLDGHVADDEEEIEEPEWLHEPVNREVLVELRGFDDDDVCSTTTNNEDCDSERNGQAPIAKLKPPARSTPTKKRDAKRVGSNEFCFDDFSNPRASYDGHFSNRKMYQNSRFPQWINGNQNQRNSSGGNLNKSSTTSTSSLNSSMNRSNSSFYQGQNNNYNNNNQNTNKFFNMWQQQQRPNPLNPANNNENVNYMNQLQLQQHQQQNVLNIADIENKIKQNNNLLNLLSQIKQNQYQNQVPARRSDFDKFMDKIASNNSFNANRVNNAYPQAGNFGNMQGFNGQQSNPMPQMSVNSFLESYRHAQQQQQQAADFTNAQRFPIQQRNDFKVPSAPTPEELLVHTQNIMRNAIIRKQNEKSEKQ